MRLTGILCIVIAAVNVPRPACTPKNVCLTCPKPNRDVAHHVAGADIANRRWEHPPKRTLNPGHVHVGLAVAAAPVHFVVSCIMRTCDENSMHSCLQQTPLHIVTLTLTLTPNPRPNPTPTPTPTPTPAPAPHSCYNGHPSPYVNPHLTLTLTNPNPDQNPCPDPSPYPHPLPHTRLLRSRPWGLQGTPGRGARGCCWCSCTRTWRWCATASCCTCGRWRTWRRACRRRWAPRPCRACSVSTPSASRLWPAPRRAYSCRFTCRFVPGVCSATDPVVRLRSRH